jgi:hypothetical protein
MQAKSKEQEQGRNPWSRCPGRPAIGWSRQNSVRSEIYEPRRLTTGIVRWPFPGSVCGTSPRGTTRLTVRL